MYRIHRFKHLIHHIDGFDFLAVDNFRVYLRGAHIGMSHHLAGGIKVNPCGYQHRAVGMAAQMEMKVSFQPGQFSPFTQMLVQDGM